MLVPSWIGYFMLVTLSLVLTGVGLFLIVVMGNTLLRFIIPGIWEAYYKLKIRNMPKPIFDNFILSLRYTWEQMNKENKDKAD